MAKQMWKALDDNSPSQYKLRNLPRQPDGLHNMHINEYGDVVKRAGFTKYNADVIGEGLTLTGTVAIDESSTAVVGTNTLFDDELVVGDLIKIVDEMFTVSVITSNFALTIDSAYQGVNASGKTAYKLYKIVGMHRYYKQDLTRKFLVAWYEDIYYLDDDGVHGEHSIKSSLTADSDTYFCDFLNTCYIVNGVNGVFKYNDNGFKAVGVTKPTAPSVSLTSSGSSLGEGVYKFLYTYIDDDGYESNPSDESNEVTVTATKEHITVPLSGTTYRKNVYRTAVGGAIFYKDNDVIIPAGTETHDSNRADGTLGTIVKVNHDAPEGTSHLITKRREKLYLAYQDYLYPSYTSDVEYFPTLWRLRTGNSQKIMGLLEQLTALPVTTEDSIERLVGTDEDNFEFRNSYSTEGCIAMRSYVNCDNLLVYLGINGINYFDGVSSGIFSEKLNEYIKANIVADKASLSCSTYWDNKYILCYPKKDSTGDPKVPTETIWYDLKNKTYGVYSYAFSCFSKWDRGDDGLQLFGGSNKIGRVYKITGLSDYDEINEIDVNIVASDQIDFLDFGMPEREKDYYKIYVRAEVTSTSVLTVTYQTDIASPAPVTATLTALKDQWYVLDLPDSVTGRAIKLKFGVENQLAVTFKGYMIQYSISALRV